MDSYYYYIKSNYIARSYSGTIRVIRSNWNKILKLQFRKNQVRNLSNLNFKETSNKL